MKTMNKSFLSRRSFLKNAGLLVAGGSLGLQRLNQPDSDNDPIIDIHQHMHYVGRTDEQMLAHQRKMGATKTVLLPAGSLAYTASTHYGNTNGLLAGA